MPYVHVFLAGIFRIRLTFVNMLLQYINVRFTIVFWHILCYIFHDERRELWKINKNIPSCTLSLLASITCCPFTDVLAIRQTNFWNSDVVATICNIIRKYGNKCLMKAINVKTILLMLIYFQATQAGFSRNYGRPFTINGSYVCCKTGIVLLQEMFYESAAVWTVWTVKHLIQLTHFLEPFGFTII